MLQSFMLVRVLAIGDPATYGYLEPGLGILASFRQATGIDTSFDILGWDDYVPTLFNLTLEADEPQYDVVMVCGHMWLAEFAHKGYLLPLDNLEPYSGDSNLADDLLPCFLDEATHGGARYLVPAFPVSHVAVGDRRAQVELAADGAVNPLEIPLAAQRLVHSEGRPAWIGKVCIREILLDWVPYVHALGGRVFADDGAPLFNSPEGRRALEIYISGRSHILPGYEPYGNEELAMALGTGEAALGVTWGSQLGLLSSARPRPAYREFTEQRWYRPLTTPFSVLWSFGILRRSPIPDAAARLLSWLSAPETDRMVATYAGAPVRRSTYEDPEIRERCPWIDASRASAERAVQFPAIPAMAYIGGPLYRHVHDAWHGLVTPEQALKRAEDDVWRTLENNGRRPLQR